MDDGALRRVRTEASRDDYASMARLARALYETGRTPQEVLRECYGVAFPAEFFVLAEADPWRLGLLVVLTNQPWRLTIPLARGGPSPAPTVLEPAERRLLALDPDLVPLMYLLGPDTESWEDKMVLCYRLSELTAGRPVVFGVLEKATRRDEVARRGDSLLAVLHDLHATHVRELERQLNHADDADDADDWDVVEEEEVDASRELLARVEALQDEVAAREMR